MENLYNEEQKKALNWGEDESPVSFGRNSPQFWGEGINAAKLIDRFVYKGRGRPRNTDYCTLEQLQRKLNIQMNKMLDAKK